MSRHIYVMFKCNYVMTKRKIVTTTTSAILESKTNFVATDRKVSAIEFVQFISYDIAAKKNIVMTHFVLF